MVPAARRAAAAATGRAGGSIARHDAFSPSFFGTSVEAARYAAFARDCGDARRAGADNPSSHGPCGSGLASALSGIGTAADTQPSEAALGVPILPNAQYLGSYDAGGAAQRFYLFGTGQGFLDVVAYYRTVLKQKGELVFEVPPTHMFDVGKFKETDCAFPPGVTVKDYALNGAAGLANPRLGATPAAFPTVIQIVPPPQLPPARPR